MGYIKVVYGGYKNGYKKRLMQFSPPIKCFYEDVLSNILHTTSSETLRQSFKLVLIFKVSNFNSQILFLPLLLLLWTKVVFHEI